MQRLDEEIRYTIAFNLSPWDIVSIRKSLFWLKWLAGMHPRFPCITYPCLIGMQTVFHACTLYPMNHLFTTWRSLITKKVGHTFLKIHHFKIPNTFKCFAIWGVTKKKIFFFKIYFTSSIPPLPPLLEPPCHSPTPIFSSCLHFSSEKGRLGIRQPWYIKLQ